MKFSIFPQFGAQNSKPVFTAFVQGAKKLGYNVTEHDLNADIMVIWSVLWYGRMQSNKEIWDKAKQLGKKILVLEVGGLKRGITWRVGLNHVNNLGFFGNNDSVVPNRSEKLGIKLNAWTMNGTNIVICGQHSKSEQWSSMPHPTDWLKSTVDLIKKHSCKPIIFRPHPRDWHWAANFTYKDIKVKIPKHLQGTYDDFDLDNDLANAWAVVNPCANSGILSIINGVPAFVTKDSLAAEVANLDLSNIDSPNRPRREEWLEKICHCEWTIEEIAQGLPLIRIFA